ncbi:MAG: hormogonium polysaccharide secretion pseudopilin HpsC [Coleofasciculus sp. C1-SOL-03]|uniref:hormogonium polysaccharide secretion pseudopilin HpsC n=1 Tax=Coleofasciculus sp. C1-SOL-03 TaxID=3069522 RepID=UPI0032F871EC
MREAIQSIFKSQPKGSGSAQKTKGFTLIELLVAIILAALVITPLLGFMVNLLATDRKEQAKSTTGQELQSALDYIARELEQAVYIYDGEGLHGTGDNGIADNLDLDGEPLLAFWKRKRLPRAVDKNFEAEGDLCPDNISEQAKERQCNDYFVYSLVVYSLIDEDNDQWSNAARIARFEISDGIRDPNDSDTYIVPQDSGFELFERGGSKSLEQAMNAWDGTVQSTVGNQQAVLVDYIDQTSPDDNDAVFVPEDNYCLSRLGLDRNGDGVIDREEDKTDKKTPEQLKTLPDNPESTSFFACVDTERTLAQIYIRGNALARIQNDAEYAEDSPYFPESTITVDGIGSIE